VTESLLDPNAVPAPTRMASPTAVAHYASGLRLVPHQLRKGRQAPRLSDITVGRSGMRDLTRFAAAQEASRPPGRIGPATLPSRLVF
jgi:hypothetical protein